MNKKDIRSEMVIKRDSIERDTAAELSERIRKRVLSLDEFKSSDDVFLYCSFRSEVDTRRLIEDTIEIKGKVYLPKVVSRTKMIFVKVSSIDELKKGFRGIFEPEGNEESSVLPGLILVPLLAYDLNGIRLGYGGVIMTGPCRCIREKACWRHWLLKNSAMTAYPAMKPISKWMRSLHQRK